MSPISSTHITFRSIFFYFFVCAGIVVFVAYILFQARFMLEGPQITLIETKEAAINNHKVVSIEGRAQNIVRMTLNGRQIFTDASGNFKEALVLENGYTVATLHAEDRYGRIRNITKEFVHVTKQNELGIN